MDMNVEREVNVNDPDSWDEDDVRFLLTRDKITEEQAMEALDIDNVNGLRQWLNGGEVSVPNVRTNDVPPEQRQADPRAEFEGLTKDELKNLMDEEGVEYSSGDTKADLIEAIVAHRQATGG